ncbi:MAG: cofactor-independent phosphoglycerate mutase [Lachnospiraceae bacterium]|nr:cofactor-independent phosphoglycerate mutase [Lachnospiraceae bacterium]
MKYVVILGDGMADRPLEELGGQTPLEYAKTPMMDALAEMGEIGMVKTVPDDMKPGSDVANLAVLGYDPSAYYSGRSPLEALSIGIAMKETDVAMRVNLVTLIKPEGASDDIPFEELIISDHSSGEISTEDAAILLDALRPAIENDEFKFYVGTSYRHCCIWDQGKILDLTQPHDHLGEVIGSLLPDCGRNEDVSADAQRFTEMMKKSYEILDHHSLNEERRKQGKNVANCLWFWGAGKKPMLSPFIEKTGKKGVMISAVDLLKGIGCGAEMKVCEVEGANAQLETNYEGKAQAALDALLKEGYDFAYIHVEAPDEMGHQGSIERKVKSIEYLDQRLIRPVYEGLQGEDFRMLIMPDHRTPICIRTHSGEPVPYILFDSTAKQNNTWHYNEREGELSGNYITPGYTMISHLFGKQE